MQFCFMSLTLLMSQSDVVGLRNTGWIIMAKPHTLAVKLLHCTVRWSNFHFSYSHILEWIRIILFCLWNRMEPPVYSISKCFFCDSPENAISIGQITHVWSSLLLKNHGCAGESRRPTKLSIPQSGSSESSESSASRRPSPRTGRDDLRNFTWLFTQILGEFHHDRSQFEAWKSWFISGNSSPN